MPPERTRSSSVHPRALRSPVDDRAKAYGVVVDRSVRRHGELVARSTRVVPSCCRRSYPGHSAPCVHLLVGRGAWLHTVRARAPRAWSIAPRRASTCSEGVEHCSTPSEHVLRGSGTLLHVVRARAPRAWSIAPRRASTRSEGLEHCSTSCEHCSEGVEHCSTSCEHCSEGVEHCSTSCEHGYNLAARRNLPAGSFVPLTRSRRSRDFRLRRLSAVRTCWIAHQIRTVAGVELCSSCRGHSGCVNTYGGHQPEVPARGRM